MSKKTNAIWSGAILLTYLLCSRALYAHDAGELRGYQVREIAQGNFVHVGSFPPQSVDNHGDIANIGFIVGDKCVAVIDTGSTLRVGASLKNAVHSVTSLPICAVVITHVHPDHLLGLNAFTQDPDVVIYGHHRLPKQIRSRSRFYLDTLERDMNVDDVDDHVIDPSGITTVRDVTSIDLGNRVINIRAWDYAHTDHDLSITDTNTGTFWAGDLVFSDHIPILDSNARQYDEVLKELKTLDVERYIVGHGPLDRPWKTLIDEQREYLELLMREVRAAIADGVSLMDAVNTVGWSAEDDWHNFELYHRRNVTTTYTDLEWEE